MNRTGLARHTPLRRHTRLAQRHRPTPRTRYTGPTPEVVAVVVQRDQGCCVACGTPAVGTRGSGWSLHHRVRRSQGGQHTPEVLVLLCGTGTTGCHGEVHARPAWARQHGWLLRFDDNPATTPADHAVLGGPALLTSDGRAVPTAWKDAA